MKISKELKKKGKVAFDGPQRKDRKKFAPPTKVEKPKKGKGSYNHKPVDEDEEAVVEENAHIVSMIEAIIQKNYSDAYKYLNQAVGSKLQKRMEAELSTPLF